MSENESRTQRSGGVGVFGVVVMVAPLALGLVYNYYGDAKDQIAAKTDAKEKADDAYREAVDKAAERTGKLRADLLGVDVDADGKLDDRNGDGVFNADDAIIPAFKQEVEAANVEFDRRIRSEAGSRYDRDEEIAAEAARIARRLDAVRQLHLQELAALGQGGNSTTVAIEVTFFAGARPTDAPKNGLPTIAAQSGTPLAWTKFSKQDDAVVAACKLVTDAAAANPSLALLPLVRKMVGGHALGDGWTLVECPSSAPAAAPAPATP